MTTEIQRPTKLAQHDSLRCHCSVSHAGLTLSCTMSFVAKIGAKGLRLILGMAAVAGIKTHIIAHHGATTCVRNRRGAPSGTTSKLAKVQRSTPSRAGGTQQSLLSARRRQTAPKGTQGSTHNCQTFCGGSSILSGAIVGALVW